MDDLVATRQCHCARLRRASRAMTRHYERHFRNSGLKATQFTLLSVLAQSGPVGMSQLAQLLDVERTTLPRATGPLVARGLVTAEGGNDARTRILSVTAAGRALLAETLPRWHAAQETAPTMLAKLGLASTT